MSLWPFPVIWDHLVSLGSGWELFLQGVEKALLRMRINLDWSLEGLKAGICPPPHEIISECWNKVVHQGSGWEIWTNSCVSGSFVKWSSWNSWNHIRIEFFNETLISEKLKLYNAEAYSPTYRKGMLCEK